MAVRTVWRVALPIVFCATAAWAQMPTANSRPCPPVQQASAVAAPAIRPVGPPESGAPAVPVAQNVKLSKRDKFKVFLRYTYSPYTFAGAGFNAGLAQATGGWHSYGGGMEGYGKRYGAALADAESGASFGAFLFPVLFNQDPRYLRSSSRKFSKHEPKRLQKLEQSPRVEKIEQMMLGPVALLPCGRETTREDWKQLVG